MPEPPEKQRQADDGPGTEVFTLPLLLLVPAS